jgi:hypothetical protein
MVMLNVEMIRLKLVTVFQALPSEIEYVNKRWSDVCGVPSMNLARMGAHGVWFCCIIRLRNPVVRGKEFVQ